MNKQWERYLKYLMLWVLTHNEKGFEGMSPACYDEFCDNDDESLYYDSDLDYESISMDCESLIRSWSND